MRVLCLGLAGSSPVRGTKLRICSMKRILLTVAFLCISGCASVHTKDQCEYYHWPHVDLKDCNGTVVVLK